MNRGKFQICNFVVLLVAICSISACSRSGKGVEASEGYHAIDANHSLFCRTENDQWNWGIIVPTWEVPGMWLGKTNAGAIYYKSGIGIQRFNNTVTITNSTKTVTFEIEPKTIYLIDTNLVLQKTKDLSGLKIVRNRVQSGGHDGEPPAGTWITEYDLQLPVNLLDRFKP